MDDATISAIVSELAPLLVGRAPGKTFQLAPQSMAIDFGTRAHGYLFISAEPAAPRFYLIRRRARDLEKACIPLTPFALSLRKELAQTTLTRIEKLPHERVVVLTFQGWDELGAQKRRRFIAQLTGRSANLFLEDGAGVITARARETKGAGQSIGEEYQPPKSGGRPASQSPAEPALTGGKSISERLDLHYTSRDANKALESQLAAARAELGKEISRRKKLLKRLEHDLTEHADAERQKRLGDLLLANIGTTKRTRGRLKLIDYFTEGTPEIEIEIDEKRTIPEEAAHRFELYSHSKRARVQIANRIKEVKAELAEFETKLERAESLPTSSDLLDLLPVSRRPPAQKSGRGSKTVPGARRYLSTDGYEILVGRAARDNDNLTFKIARPNDLWLHAADYPGSHVIVRNPTRKEIPHRTLIEAAQLAAHFSQASKDPKVTVHYTERKFLSKPRGAAAGLVRMSRFRSLTVAPAKEARRIL